MSTVFIGFGSNMGDRERNIREALRMLEERGAARVVRVSSLVETAPVGVVDQPDFVNGVAQLETDLPPRELLAVALDVERQMGRERTIRWGPRVIDIDILLYDELVVSEEGLIIPHPEMMNRSFVLEPLAVIAPDLILPSGLTAKAAAEKLRPSGFETLDTRH